MLDNNISRVLVHSLAVTYPGSLHVSSIGLSEATDESLWNYARENNFCIVSKDSDFRNKSFLHGAPPKVIWIAPGECKTENIGEYFYKHERQIHDFLTNADLAILIADITEP